MDLVAIVGLNVLGGIASLVLISLGLAIIFGMMRVINLAHGEFLMLGAYATVVTTNQGLNIWVAMLVVAPLSVGLFGLLVERVFIRLLYGRLVETMLATWGLSLFIVGMVTTIFGNTIQGVSTPLGSFEVGSYRSDLYTLVLVLMAAVLLAGVVIVMRFTRFGLVARATMQNPGMASALGVNPARIYMTTFAIGAAATGLAGGLLAPVSGVSPVMGSAFVAKAFITVVGGGASILAGTASASTLFGLINQLGSYLTTPVYGEVLLLAAATVLIRILPEGITGRFFRESL